MPGNRARVSDSMAVIFNSTRFGRSPRHLSIKSIPAEPGIIDQDINFFRFQKLGDQIPARVFIFQITYKIIGFSTQTLDLFLNREKAVLPARNQDDLYSRAARSRATCLPIPLEAPVINAVFPLNDIFDFILLTIRCSCLYWSATI